MPITLQTQHNTPELPTFNREHSHPKMMPPASKAPHPSHKLPNHADEEGRKSPSFTLAFLQTPACCSPIPTRWTRRLAGSRSGWGRMRREGGISMIKVAPKFTYQDHTQRYWLQTECSSWQVFLKSAGSWRAHQRILIGFLLKKNQMHKLKQNNKLLAVFHY